MNKSYIEKNYIWPSPLGSDKTCIKFNRDEMRLSNEKIKRVLTRFNPDK